MPMFFWFLFFSVMLMGCNDKGSDTGRESENDLLITSTFLGTPSSTNITVEGTVVGQSNNLVRMPADRPIDIRLGDGVAGEDTVYDHVTPHTLSTTWPDPVWAGARVICPIIEDLVVASNDPPLTLDMTFNVFTDDYWTCLDFDGEQSYVLPALYVDSSRFELPYVGLIRIDGKDVRVEDWGDDIPDTDFTGVTGEFETPNDISFINPDGSFHNRCQKTDYYGNPV
jgi:hypothetical protein